MILAIAQSEIVVTSIHLLGVRIDEPVTTATDLVITAVCLYAFFALRRRRVAHVIYRLLRGFFLLLALATLWGGVMGHGFLYAVTFHWKLPGWAFAMVAINLIERVVILYSKPYIRKGFVRFFSWLNVLELVVFAGLAFSTLNFRYVEIHAAYGLLIFVFSFSLFHYIRRNDRAVFKWFLAAVLTVAVSDFFFLSGIGLGPWFNYIDISHMLLAVGAWFFYIGAAQMLLALGDRRVPHPEASFSPSV